MSDARNATSRRLPCTRLHVAARSCARTASRARKLRTATRSAPQDRGARPYEAAGQRAKPESRCTIPRHVGTRYEQHVRGVHALDLRGDQCGHPNSVIGLQAEPRDERIPIVRIDRIRVHARSQPSRLGWPEGRCTVVRQVDLEASGVTRYSRQRQLICGRSAVVARAHNERCGAGNYRPEDGCTQRPCATEHEVISPRAHALSASTWETGRR